MSTGETEVQQDSAAKVRGPRHLQRSRRGRHAARPRIGLYLGAAIIAATGIGWPLLPTSSPTTPGIAVHADMALADAADRARVAENDASRSKQRGQVQPSRQPTATATAHPKPSQTKPSAPASSSPASSPSPTVRGPVGGLTQAEMNNAVAIIEAGQQLKLPRRAFVVAIATALQESHLRNLANANLPESLKHPNEGVGYDHDSVGLFQQRPNWGTVAQLMDPHESARRFYSALAKIPGWEQLQITVAAQTVQVSAYPDAYAKWQTLAQQIVDAVA
ncbi:hypothetical protein AB0K00_55650 [Dactylosporangium sp. NPDC049525]|uniref:hypothetical protein n=1 Tax=Dactylosporangium sp. NPDC049525 TaxID=3154730 RepID=UPI003435F80D